MFMFAPEWDYKSKWREGSQHQMQRRKWNPFAWVTVSAAGFYHFLSTNAKLLGGAGAHQARAVFVGQSGECVCELENGPESL